MATNAERQRAFRERRAAAHIYPVTGYCRTSQRAGVIAMLAFLVDNPEYEVAMVRSTVTGKLKKVGV